jgi:hypothetical protein
MNTDDPPGAGAVLRGADRRHRFPGRLHRINLRLDDDEHRDLVMAAGRAGLTVTGFCTVAAIAAARGTASPASLIDGTGITHSELAALQRDLFAARTAVVRTGTNLNQAVAALNATGQPPIWLDHAVARCDRALHRLDAVIAGIDRRLR